MLPRIFPWVPLPGPGAPTRSMVRNFISTFHVLVTDLDGLNFYEGNHHLGGGVPALQLEVHFVRGNAADAFAHVFAPHSLDDDDQVLFRLARHDAEKAGEFGLEKSPVEGEFAPRVDLWLGRSAFLFLRRRQRQSAWRRVSRAAKSRGRLGGRADCFGGEGFLRLGVAVFDVRGQAKENERRQARQQNGKAADQRDGLPAVQSDLVGGVEIGQHQHGEDGQANGSNKRGQETRLAGRPLHPVGHRFDDDFLLPFPGFDLLRFELDKRFDERRDFGIFDEVLQGFLREIDPRFAFGKAADIQLHHPPVLIRRSEFTAEDVAVGQLEFIGGDNAAQLPAQADHEPNTIINAAHLRLDSTLLARKGSKIEAPRRPNPWGTTWHLPTNFCRMHKAPRRWRADKDWSWVTPPGGTPPSRHQTGPWP